MGPVMNICACFFSVTKMNVKLVILNYLRLTVCRGLTPAGN